MKNKKKNISYYSSPSGYEFGYENSMSSEFSDIRLLSSNEMHSIYRGVRYGRIWIIKGLNESFRHIDECRQMLRKEFDIMMRVQHDNIVQAHTFEQIEPLGTCIVMEYVNGDSLDEWLRDNHTLPERYQVAVELADACCHISRCGIVHRDIKLENIVISRINGRVKIIDFGLADTDDYTMFKNPAGTEGYISPEQRTLGVPDVRNDVYSFGKVLDHLLPEKRFAKTRKKCVDDIESRITNFEELASRLHSDYNKYRRIWLGIAVVCVIAGVAVYNIVWRESAANANESSFHTDTVAVTAKIPESRTDGAVETVPLAVSAEMTTAVPTAVRRVNAELSEVIARIDGEWNRTAMHYLDTVDPTGDMYPEWSTSQLEIIRNKYLDSLSNYADEETVEQAKNELDKQITKNYRKWHQRRLSIKVN